MGIENSRMCGSLQTPELILPANVETVPIDKDNWHGDAWKADFVHYTKEEDTLKSIAARYHKSIDHILKYNRALRFMPDPHQDQLVPGQQLRVPPDNRDHFFFLVRSAAMDIAEAQYLLARWYKNGDGISSDGDLKDPRNPTASMGIVELEWEKEEELQDPDRHSLTPSESVQTRANRHKGRFLFWIRTAADNAHRKKGTYGLPKAQYELAQMYFDGTLWRYLSDADRQSELEEVLDKVDAKVSANEWPDVIKAIDGHPSVGGSEQASDDDEVGAKDEDDMKHEAAAAARAAKVHATPQTKARSLRTAMLQHWKLKAATLHGLAADLKYGPSALALADMYRHGTGVKMNYKDVIFWLQKSGMSEREAQKKAAQWFQDDAEAGGDKAAYQLAIMFVYGVGVDLDFGRAIFWYQRGGKSEKYAKQQIKKRFRALRSKYEELFNAWDIDGDGEIDREEFQQFYRDTLMAKGMSRKTADLESVKKYQGRRKADTLYDSYDINKDGKITFDEVWAHTHTHTALIVHTEPQLKAALTFFKKWRRRQSTLAQNEVEDMMRDRQIIEQAGPEDMAAADAEAAELDPEPGPDDIAFLGQNDENTFEDEQDEQ